MSLVERGSSALTVVPMSCPPWMWSEADRHRAGFTGLVSTTMWGGVSNIHFGGQQPQVYWVDAGKCVSHREIRIQIHLYSRGISSELSIRSFKHSRSPY